MLHIPDWADLGRITSNTALAWESEISNREKYRFYYDGLVFKDRLPMEVDDDVPVLMYPVGLNLVKMLTLSQTDSLFGEWDEDIVSFEMRKEERLDSPGMQAIRIAQGILRSSNANARLWEVGFDGNLYGGGAIKVTPNHRKPGRIEWFHVPLQNFFPVWDPDDPDLLLECYVVTPMNAEQARIRYGYTGSAELVTRVEHWTPSQYENKIEGKRIDAYSGINPWGFVPFVYIPRFRSTNWWGDGVAQDIIPVQDELNARVADIGEAINYNAHPVRWGRNLPRGFNVRNFPIGSNAMWDLGRTLGNAPPPEVGMLEATAAVSQGTHDYVNFLYDWSRTSSFAPPVAFGDDDGGGQRSGATLEIRMWPLIKSVRRQRAFLGIGIQTAMQMSALILKQKQYSDIPVRPLERLAEGSVVPKFADIMPRDHQAIVDEVVKLLSTDPPSISPESAQKALGRGPGEVERIKEFCQDEDWRDIMQNFKQRPMHDEIKAEHGRMQPQAKKDAE
jgi:hypothetical protein